MSIHQNKATACYSQFYHTICYSISNGPQSVTPSSLLHSVPLHQSCPTVCHYISTTPQCVTASELPLSLSLHQYHAAVCRPIRTTLQSVTPLVLPYMLSLHRYNSTVLPYNPPVQTHSVRFHQYYSTVCLTGLLHSVSLHHRRPAMCLSISSTPQRVIKLDLPKNVTLLHYYFTVSFHQYNPLFVTPSVLPHNVSLHLDNATVLHNTSNAPQCVSPSVTSQTVSLQQY